MVPAVHRREHEQRRHRQQVPEESPEPPPGHDQDRRRDHRVPGRERVQLRLLELVDRPRDGAGDRRRVERYGVPVEERGPRAVRGNREVPDVGNEKADREGEDVPAGGGNVSRPQKCAEDDREEVVRRIGDVEESRQRRTDQGLEEDGDVAPQDRAVCGDQKVVSRAAAGRRDQDAQALVNEGNEGGGVEVGRDPERFGEPFHALREKDDDRQERTHQRPAEKDSAGIGQFLPDDQRDGAEHRQRRQVHRFEGPEPHAGSYSRGRESLR